MLAIIQVVAVVAGIGYGLPQIIRVLRAKSTSGISLFAWQLIMATTTAWTAHGILLAAPSVIASNLAGVVESTWIFALILRERGLRLLREVWLPIGLVAVCLGVRIGLGAAAFGAFVVIPQIVSMSGQLLALIRAGSLRGVSPVFLGYGVVLQAIWLVYAILAPDVAIIIAAVATGAVCLFTVVWYLLRQRGVVAAHPGFGRREGSARWDGQSPVDPPGDRVR